MKSRGFTLIELLVYAVVAALVLVAVAMAVQMSYRFYRELTIGPRVDRVGISITERIIRDIRTGNDIVLEESTFGVPTGSLAVSVPAEGGSVTKHVAVQDSQIVYWEDSGAAQALTPDDMYVSRFLLTHITTPISEGVRFELELTYTTPEGTNTRSFTGLSILRRSYE